MLSTAKGGQIGEMRWLKAMGNMRMMMPMSFSQVYDVLTTCSFEDLDPSYQFAKSPDLNPILF
jgi:hypothetical protein